LSYQFDKIFARESMDSGNDGIASHTLAMTTRYFYFGKMVSHPLRGYAMTNCNFYFGKVVSIGLPIPTLSLYILGMG
jgi:hypothetical protein